jgi:hypothetical protein
MSKNLQVDLKKTQDRNGSFYYIGKIKCPATIDLKDGIVFLIFTSEEGEEQLQIASLEVKEKDDTFRP